MTTGQTTPEHRHDPDIAALLDLLCTMYPKTFSRYEARRKPLKVGIDHDLVVTLDGAVTTAELDRALGCYTANRVYRSRLRGAQCGSAWMVGGRNRQCGACDRRTSAPPRARHSIITTAHLAGGAATLG